MGDTGSCISSSKRAVKNGEEATLFQGLKEHAREFMEATPEQHKQ